MTNLTIHFKEQLEKAKPCDGDYLQGESIDHIVNYRLQQYNTMLGLDGSQFRQERENMLRDSIEYKIKEYQLHRGEKVVFFINEREDESFEVLKAWESELHKLHEKYDFVHRKVNTIPHLKSKC